jgi:DUF971 family protein
LQDRARARKQRKNTTKRGVEMNDFDAVGEYAVPVDPMDDLQCESCQ